MSPVKRGIFVFALLGAAGIFAGRGLADSGNPWIYDTALRETTGLCAVQRAMGDVDVKYTRQAELDVGLGLTFPDAAPAVKSARITFSDGTSQDYMVLAPMAQTITLLPGGPDGFSVPLGRSDGGFRITVANRTFAVSNADAALLLSAMAECQGTPLNAPAPPAPVALTPSSQIEPPAPLEMPPMMPLPQAARGAEPEAKPVTKPVTKSAAKPAVKPAVTAPATPILPSRPSAAPEHLAIEQWSKSQGSPLAAAPAAPIAQKSVSAAVPAPAAANTATSVIENWARQPAPEGAATDGAAPAEQPLATQEAQAQPAAAPRHRLSEDDGGLERALLDEWAEKIGLLEKENAALRDKTGGQPAALTDIRVDPMAKIREDALRKKVTELQEELQKAKADAQKALTDITEKAAAEPPPLPPEDDANADAPAEDLPAVASQKGDQNQDADAPQKPAGPAFGPPVPVFGPPFPPPTTLMIPYPSNAIPAPETIGPPASQAIDIR